MSGIVRQDRNRIYTLRKALCMSMEDFARRLGKSTTWAFKHEINAEITEEDADIICPEFHVRRDWLLNGNGEIFEEGCDPSCVGERIVQLRKALCYTQDDLVEILDSSRSSIMLIEQGKSEAPVNALVEKLHVRKDWLLTGKGEMGVQLPNYGEHIRELREYLGLSFTAMGQEIELHPDSLSRIESGRLPSKETIEKIEEKYGVKDNWLRYGEGPMFEEGKEKRKKEPIDGARILKLRTSQKLSRVEFAKRIGMGRQSVELMEKGTMSVMEGTVERILSAFPVSEMWLRYGEGRMYREGFSGPKDKPKVVPERILELRKSLGLTQEEFSKRAGIGHTLLWDIEKGNAPITQKTINGICSGFNVNEDWLRGKDVVISSKTGERVKALRKHLNLGLRDLGAKIGMSYQNLLNMEQGVYSFTEAGIKKISEATGASEDWLLYGREPMFQEGKEVPAYKPKGEIIAEEKAEKKALREKEKAQRKEEIERRRLYVIELRKQYNLSQAKFAKLIGRPAPTISMVETGKVGVSDNMLEQIHKAFDDRSIPEKTSDATSEKQADPKKRGSKVPVENPEDVRNRLIDLRKKEKLTQKELAAKIGCSLPTVSNVERGVTKPTMGYIDKIVGVYGIDKEWILYGKGEGPAQEDLSELCNRLTLSQKERVIEFIKTMIEG